MNRWRVALGLVLLSVVLTGCKLKEEQSSAPPGGMLQVPPPADVAAPPANALRTPSGLSSKVLTVGLGSIHPTLSHRVTVHYTGWTPDGTTFDSSLNQGGPITFSLNEVISGWTEALQLMVVGEKRRFWIPGHLAYDGVQGKPQGMLVFDIELLDIK